jgi:hypothetical protein
MRRLIVDYSKLTREILDLLVAKYPEGYNAMDIISFRDMNKNLIEAVQVDSEDTIYLVKVSKKLQISMEEHDIDADFDSDDTLFEEDDLIFREDPEIGEEPDFDE